LQTVLISSVGERLRAAFANKITEIEIIEMRSKCKSGQGRENKCLLHIIAFSAY